MTFISLPGPLPRALCFGLLPKTTVDGDFMESTTSYMPQRLESFDLRLDGQSISSYALKTRSKMYHSFYQKFLSEINMMSNPFSSGTLNYTDFVSFNFIIPENLARKKITHGDLTAVLKFTEALPEILYLVVFTIDTKCVVFDEYLNMNVTNMTGDVDEEADE